MKYHVKFSLGKVTMDEIIEGENAADLLHKAKLMTSAKVKREMGWIAGAFVKKMGDMSFACECVKRYDKATGQASKMPLFPGDFLAWAVGEGLAYEVKEGGDKTDATPTALSTATDLPGGV